MYWGATFGLQALNLPPVVQPNQFKLLLIVLSWQELEELPLLKIKTYQQSFTLNSNY